MKEALLEALQLLKRCGYSMDQIKRSLIYHLWTIKPYRRSIEHRRTTGLLWTIETLQENRRLIDNISSSGSPSGFLSAVALL